MSHWEPGLIGDSVSASQDLDINAVLVLATLRSSQFPAGASHDGAANGVSGRALATHNTAERTPNVPGDTPWHANGTPAHACDGGHVLHASSSWSPRCIAMACSRAPSWQQITT